MAGYKVYLGLNGSDVNRILKDKPSIAVIDFAEFGDTQINKLRAKGIKLISYLNVGAIERNRPYFKTYKKYAIGKYSDWDELWMDISQIEWKDALAGQARIFKARGADGLYIDNLDVVEEYKPRNLYPHAVELLNRIRQETGLYLMVNGADFFVTNAVLRNQRSFQAIQQEEVFTRITDIEGNKAKSQKPKEKKRLKAYCISAKKRGLDVYLLEYRPSASNKVKIKTFCKKYGMLYYNSRTVDLV